MASFSGVSMVSGIKSQVTGAVHSNLQVQMHNHAKSGISRFFSGTGTAFNSKRTQNLPVLYFHSRDSGTWQNLFAERSPQMNYNDDYNTDPFFLSLIKQIMWTARSLFLFLIQQPSELKYIEWPSFESTLKTAALTLSLIALLIVALSSVDSALSYLLAVFLRKKA